jgi:hypothetical protein
MKSCLRSVQRAGNLELIRQRFLLKGLQQDPRWGDLERRIATVGPPK